MHKIYVSTCRAFIKILCFAKTYFAKSFSEKSYSMEFVDRGKEQKRLKPQTVIRPFNGSIL